jgi:ATP-binding cassette subfamily B protein
LAPLLRRQWVLISLSFLALFAEVAFHCLEPWPLKFVFDNVLKAKRAGQRYGLSLALEGMNSGTLLLLAAGAVVLFTGLRALSSYGSAVGFAVVANRVLTEIRGSVYRHLQRLSLGYHAKASSGDLIVRVIADVNQLKQMTINAALPLFADLLIVVTMLTVMFWLQWRLALVALAPLPLFCFWTVRFTRRVQQASRRLRQREGAMAGTAGEALGAIKLVQAMSLEGLFEDAFQEHNLESQREDIKALRLTARLGRTVSFLIAISIASVLWYGANLVLGGELTPGELLVFLAYLRNAYRPLQDFGKYSGRIAKATAGGERVLHVLEQVPDVADLPGAVPAPPFRGAIEFEGVNFAYEPGQEVLEQVHFTVEPGQHVALVGPSGAGKTTITALLLRLYDPSHGRVRIDGRDIREYTLASLRRQFSVVLQDPFLIGTTVAANIAFGAPSASRTEIEAAAHLTNAGTFIERLPGGFDSVLGERGVTLSNGQRQRLALARAALRQAPILIFDEPTTGLDEENERAVLQALRRLAQGRTTFMISHDLPVIAGADLILYLEEGRLVERGTHVELLERNGRYATLYRQQLAARLHPHHKQAVPLSFRGRSSSETDGPLSISISKTLMSNPFTFVVGCPRSGTTLLQRLLNAHPMLAMTPETHWVPKFYQDRVGLTPDGFASPELIGQLLAHPKFPKLGIHQDQLETLLKPDAPLSYAEFISAIYQLYAQTKGKPLAGDKTPGYCRHITLLHFLWPRSRFIHLIRDGRDVCLSATNWQRKLPKLISEFPTWGEDPTSTAALWWKWHVRMGRQAGDKLPAGLYYELRYENLVDDPEGQCARLCAFLDLPFDEAMLNFHKGKVRAEPGLDAKRAWLPVTPGLRNWRTQMPTEEVERFEAAAGDLLDELGYGRMSKELRDERRRHAVRIQACFPKESYFEYCCSLPQDGADP